MSAALVRKTLALTDEHYREKGGNKAGKSSLMPEDQKLKRKIVKKGRVVNKVNLLQAEKKLTVADIKKTCKPKEEILKANIKKLEQIREVCKIDLDEAVTKLLFERATTRRPVRRKEKPKEAQPTAFTEEDFKKFEEEYFDDDI